MPSGLFHRVVLPVCVSFLALAFSPGSDRMKVPQDFFAPPVDIPLRLSGTFGELRPDHFHSGLDIKGAIGHPIYAAGDGYISRISVSGSGYGNSLVLTHPNGYTTLYAHMNAFSARLAQYVRAEQERQRSFEVELQPEPTRFPVRRGEPIGEMGTTGSSFGPHLHFEIRDAQTDHPINPLLFGIPVADKAPPRLRQIRLYQLDNGGRILDARSFDLVAGKDGGFTVPGGTLYAAASRIGLGVLTFDQMDGVPNQNGIYRLRMYIEDTLAYSLHMDSFAFPESRFLNAHIDYEQQVTTGRYIHRLFRLPGNRLSIYDSLRHDGVVELPRDRPVTLTLEAADMSGNTAGVSFAVQQSPAKLPAPTPPLSHYRLQHDRDNLIDEYDLFLHFPKGTLYEDLDLFHQEWQDGSSGIFSTVHAVHDYRTPVHTAFDIGIRPLLLPDDLREKAFIAYCSRGGGVINCGGEWSDGLLRASVRAMGDYCIMVDDIPPRIEPVLFQKNMRRQPVMMFRIGDNVGAPLRYDATIDGKWALMEHDAKNALLTYRFGEDLTPGEHRLRLVVSDRQNNSRVLEEIFLR